MSIDDRSLAPLRLRGFAAEARPSLSKASGRAQVPGLLAKMATMSPFERAIDWSKVGECVWAARGRWAVRNVLRML